MPSRRKRSTDATAGDGSQMTGVQGQPITIAGAVIRERSVSDYRKHGRNANAGSVRGQDMITGSFKELGAGRSIVADRDDELIAGNHAIAGAETSGIRRVLEIATEGDVLIVHKRTDMDLDDETDARARRLAVADNRTNEVSLMWDVETLIDDPEAIKGFFREDEIEDLLRRNEIEAQITDQVAGGVTGNRLTGDKAQQVKVVLYVDEVATFEQAIKATGLRNRGQALLEICADYLKNHAQKYEGD